MKKNSEYEKMPKNLKDISEKAFQELGKVKWAVTEKVHGANFSFVYEENKLFFAKRKEYLAWNDDFFGFQLVANRLEKQIIALFGQLRLDKKAEKYIIYGELFGGKYPHSDVPKDENVQAIQTGVYYCPSIHFCAFDIALENDGQKQYLDYQTAILYFEKFDIFYAKVLFSGKLNEVLSFNTRINSTIPAQLNLPKLASNLIEGVVIKPLTHEKLKNLEFRPIIKVKNTEFDEEKKFHEAEKWSFVPNLSSQSEELSFLVEEMSNYINKNRFESVLSKIGGMDFLNKERIQAIENEFLQDVFSDFNQNNQQILDDLSESQKEWLENRIKVYIQELMIKIS